MNQLRMFYMSRISLWSYNLSLCDTSGNHKPFKGKMFAVGYISNPAMYYHECISDYWLAFLETIYSLSLELVLPLPFVLQFKPLKCIENL